MEEAIRSKPQIGSPTCEIRCASINRRPSVELRHRKAITSCHRLKWRDRRARLTKNFVRPTQLPALPVQRLHLLGHFGWDARACRCRPPPSWLPRSGQGRTADLRGNRPHCLPPRSALTLVNGDRPLCAVTNVRENLFSRIGSVSRGAIHRVIFKIPLDHSPLGNLNQKPARARIPRVLGRDSGLTTFLEAGQIKCEICAKTPFLDNLATSAKD